MKRVRPARCSGDRAGDIGRRGARAETHSMVAIPAIPDIHADASSRKTTRSAVSENEKSFSILEPLSHEQPRGRRDRRRIRLSMM